MKIHEYQAKEILRTYGVPTPRSTMALTVDDAVRAAKEMEGWPVVVKAQIHAGGRGKAGGVKLCKGPEEVKAEAQRLLGSKLVTYQTGPEGQVVRRLLVEEGVLIQSELYMGLVLDRARKRVVLMASREGGVEIEEVAKNRPEAIHTVAIDPVTGLMPYQVRQLVFGMGLDPGFVSKATKLCMALWKAYEGTDATIIELNPLIITQGGDLLTLDAKMNFDENALFRQPEVTTLRDVDEEDPKEVEAKAHDLSYIALDGNVGCMVNGAGLAMATMDIIKAAGGNPANFLDVGGGADAEKVTAAFTIILQDPEVKAVLVNIFGGIMKCDVIAEGVIAAAKKTQLRVPVVVRLEGTNVDRGKKMLAESGLSLTPADDMKDAAEKVVRLASEGRA